MVLQRDRPIPVWGVAEPGEEITVEFRAAKVTASADAAGKWRISLPAQPASGEGATLIIRGRSTLVLHDVVVGEVWVASGQSNMAFTLRRAQNATQEIAAANEPSIRVYRPNSSVAETPQTDLQGSWKAVTPEAAGGFSAVAYFFARRLAAELRVPVGIVTLARGGTSVEAWMSAQSLAGDPAFAVVGERWKKVLADYPAAKQAYDEAMAAAPARKPSTPPGPGSQLTPSGQFNALISPATGYAMRGVIWYQGEGNREHPLEYGALFRAMLGDWRARWGQGDFPFLFVQVSSFAGGDRRAANWAVLREQQAAALKLPRTGMAVTLDIGDPRDIHPTNKQEVGRRLSLLALRDVYGRADLEAEGPTLAGASVEGSRMIVRFHHAGEGLKASDGAGLSGFEISGEDGRWLPAQAALQSKDTLSVTGDKLAVPVAVRYGWRNAPSVNLVNAAGLPCAPFRTDHRDVSKEAVPPVSKTNAPVSSEEP